MKRKNKLPQNFDTKVLTINHIGSNGEGVSYLYTEFDNKEKEHHFFLAYIEISQVNNTKMSIKPYLETFYPFHISSEILKISGKALWQGSKIFQK